MSQLFVSFPSQSVAVSGATSIHSSCDSRRRRHKLDHQLILSTHAEGETQVAKFIAATEEFGRRQLTTSHKTPTQSIRKWFFSSVLLQMKIQCSRLSQYLSFSFAIHPGQQKEERLLTSSLSRQKKLKQKVRTEQKDQRRQFEVCRQWWTNNRTVLGGIYQQFIW